MREKSTHFGQVSLEEIHRHIAEGKIEKAIFSDTGDSKIQLTSKTLPYPEWQKPLQEALLELDAERLKQRIMAAELAVRSSLEKTANDDERQALVDAMSSLRFLKRDSTDNSLAS